uniref:Ribosomal protein S10 n=1 Tax=Tsukubamonas globosa TaxID=875863 RepID=W8VRB0_9EUKA|nr:ribosomal protein S10 [Tsukubamonas globosa]BAO51964.1 ribosomal protein S10 [Tsukubamonas globosa]
MAYFYHFRQKKKITVLRSPHIDKKSREQFELCTHSGYLIVKPAGDESVFLATVRKNIFSGVRCTIKKECSVQL